MNEATIIFPNQLFEDLKSLNLKKQIFIVEEWLFFKIQPFHKQRIVLLRASMKFYEHFLIQKGFTVHYIDSLHLKNRKSLFKILHEKGINELHFIEFSDQWLKKDIAEAIKTFNFKVNYSKTPMFSLSLDDIKSLMNKDKISMAKFYSYQRKKLGILMEGSSPVGGKYSFDKENRKKIPKGIYIPQTYIPKENNYVNEAKKYVDKHFKNSIGLISSFLYPTTFEEAKIALKSFIEEKLLQFGDYEDAITKEDSFLFHSVLSPMLNIGLLTPKEVVSATINAYETNSIPLNSVEGFLRQIIGWREFMRAAYEINGSFERTHNFFNHSKKLPAGFWEGSTGIEPVDTVIERVLETGYCHHIERLMVLGNFLLLTETDPDEVYNWFMANFVDAYDWVMVPNVYGMSQYADEGFMTTKPYVSGSNYILKMSNFKKGSWCDIWDGLFWRFLKKHQPLFSKNPRMSVLIKYIDKEETLVKIKAASKWLENH
jgi:deoxyribodipyrimidine photolyase-related protein